MTIGRVRNSQRPERIWGLLLGALVFAFMWVSAQGVVETPKVGALWYNSHVVYYANQNSALKVDDKIVAEDGTPISGRALDGLMAAAAGNQETNELTLSVWRDGVLQSVIEELAVSQDAWIIYNASAPLVVALFFWAIGLLVYTFSRKSSNLTWLLLIFCLTMAVVLASGGSAGWPAGVYPIVILFFTPVTLHFHSLFPTRQYILKRRYIAAGYITAVLASVPMIVVLVASERFLASNFATTMRGVLPYVYLLWLLLGISGTLYLLLRAFRTAATSEHRHQLGVVLLCACLGLLPLLALGIIPEQLTGRTLIHYEVSLVALGAIPVGYGYAVMRFRMIVVERYISRSATVLFLLLILIALYFLTTELLLRSFPTLSREQPWFQLLLIVGSVIAYNFLYPRMRTQVDNLLYGGWYDYSSVISSIAIQLDRPQDIQSLAQTLSDTVQQAMRVHWVRLILPESNDELPVEGFAGVLVDQTQIDYQLADDPVIAILATLRHPISRIELLELLDSQINDASHQLRLYHDDASLFVPIYGLENSLGILILGPKLGGDQFDDADLRILEIVSRQASIAFQNAQLIIELQAKATENEAYQRQVINVREAERQRLARELHDQIIQALIGLRYGLSNVQNGARQLNGQGTGLVGEMDSLQSDVGHLVQLTRDICLDLRPPAVDLGLVPSIRSLVNRFEMSGKFIVTFDIHGDRNVDVPEEVAICLFRCTQEGLQNIIKHAGASHVAIKLTMAADNLALVMHDNGQGFEPPARLGVLMRNNHFGLVGVRERIELLKGSFRLTSTGETGTTLEIQIPLANDLAANINRQKMPANHIGVVDVDQKSRQ